MPKSDKQKMKLLYLMRILEEKTDDDHRLSLKDIQAALLAYGIAAERKSLYDDMETLRVFGMDIIGTSLGKGYVYHVGGRKFELAELKLLVDAVQASKFITLKKSRKLIKKLGTLTSNHEAGNLERQVYVADRVKTMNESIYYNVDIVHGAISKNKKIRFQYTQWTVEAQLKLKRDGQMYEVSPWALSWDNENYYLVAFDEMDKIIKHYRVDKMMRLTQTDKMRTGREIFEQFNMAAYSRKFFGMYHGTDEMVKLQFVDELAGVVMDRFGKDVTLRREGNGRFTISVNVIVSMQFIAWVAGLGAGAKILSPEPVVDMMRGMVETLAGMYGVGEA